MEIASSSHQPPKRAKTTHPTSSPSGEPPPISSAQLLIPPIPDELSFEILSRLPTKSLVKFTAVCKSWRSIIASPHFTKSHLSNSLSNPRYPHHHLLYSSSRPHFVLYHTPLNTLLHDPVVVPRDLAYPTQQPHKSVWLIGSINGLVCIAIDEDELILWNPCLRKHKQLAPLNVKIKRGCFIVYGFGYDVRSDDYKVIAIYCVFRESNVYENEVRVYSRNNDSWKRLDGFNGGVPLDDSGKFVNGKLHWASSPGFELVTGGRCRWSIMAIDVGDEGYSELEQPDYGVVECDLVLGVLGEQVCVLSNYDKTQVDIWVMKEYGVRDSWTKFASLSYLNGPEKYRYEAPLCLLNSGCILLIGSVFVLYNPKDDSRRYPEIRDYVTCLEALVYVESLLSP